MSTPDPGLQPERTVLAWQRTSLSAAVVGALLLRTGILRGSPLDLVGAGCAAAVLVLTWVLGNRSRERGAAPGMLLVTAVCVCATGVCVVAQSLWSAIGR
jgi:uncharacterized membrane protein YidH (DUF202 family)